jgi:hypothetical protein
MGRQRPAQSGTRSPQMVEEERFVERTRGKGFVIEIRFGGRNALGEERG